MKHVLSVVVLLALLAFAVGSSGESSIESEGNGTGGSGGSGGSGDSGGSAVAATEITAGALYAEYDANEVAADEKYKGQFIIVSGTIDTIAKDIMDTMYITLDNDAGIGQIQCMFSDAHKSQLANAKKGQSVRVKGKCSGKMMNVILRGCRLQ